MLQNEDIGEAWFRRDGRRVRHVWDAVSRSWLPAQDVIAVAPAPFRPMLAESYAPGSLPVLAQPKLDGVRCIARADGLFSREGNRFADRPDVTGALAPLFDADPELVLDGELFLSGHDLFAIAAAARYGGRLDLEFHAFDIVSDSPAAERASRLAQLLDGCDEAVQLVPTLVCVTEAEVDTHYRACLASGHEGQMLRCPVAGYRGGRGRVLLKRKPREDAEAVIVAAEAHESGRIVCTLRQGEVDFLAPLPGSRRLLRMLSVLPGMQATFAFTGTLPCGKPRDAVVKIVHEWPRD